MFYIVYIVVNTRFLVVAVRSEKIAKKIMRLLKQDNPEYEYTIETEWNCY